MFHDDEITPDHPEAREGLFDAQLPLPGHFTPLATPLEVVVKRDGRQEAFDKSKIARAILAAGTADGGYDDARAASLASAVAMYLSKRAGDGLLTVDDVSTAVERVLMHMGHYRTATAFARFREKRERHRALRARRDPRGTPPAAGGRDPQDIQIQTSGETLVRWDRTRIVAALVRETGMANDAACAVASQVEAQILSAKVRTITTPLVRELVTTKLIEMGMEHYARRHRRLGVPLYDTEGILCGPTAASASQPRDPETTDWLLAECVKKEYALSEVFSLDVAEAHLLGDIHIHGLAMVDRLHTASHSIALIKRFGMDILGIGAVTGPPRTLDVFSAELAGVTMAMQRHFYGAIRWRAANVFFAPFLEGLTERELHAWAEMTLRDLAMSTAVSGRPMPPVGLELWWEIPPSLVETEAIGPGGTFTNRSYGDYEYTSQKAAQALAHAFRDLRRRGIALASPIPIVRVSPGLLRDPGYDGILRDIAALAASHSGTEIIFDRSEPWLVGEDQPWRSREVSLHCVTLNLPRAAYRGGRTGLPIELERLMPLAAAAHAQKYGLLSRILEQGEAGPLALIGRSREGAAIHELEQPVCHVGIVGLNECVRHCTGHALDTASEGEAFAAEVLNLLRDLCTFWSERSGLTLMLTATDDPIAAQRLAELDAEQYPDAAARVLHLEGAGIDLAYTPGASAPRASGMTPGERVRLEGRLQTGLGHYPASRISLPDHEMSPDAIAAFLLKALRQTSVQRLVFE